MFLKILKQGASEGSQKFSQVLRCLLGSRLEFLRFLWDLIVFVGFLLGFYGI